MDWKGQRENSRIPFRQITDEKGRQPDPLSGGPAGNR